MSQFEHALKKLVEDRAFREDVIGDPKRLTADFEDLNAQEVLLLMQVWHASGHPEAQFSIIDLCHCCCSST